MTCPVPPKGASGALPRENFGKSNQNLSEFRACFTFYSSFRKESHLQDRGRRDFFNSGRPSSTLVVELLKSSRRYSNTALDTRFPLNSWDAMRVNPHLVGILTIYPTLRITFLQQLLSATLCQSSETGSWRRSSSCTKLSPDIVSIWQAAPALRVLISKIYVRNENKRMDLCISGSHKRLPDAYSPCANMEIATLLLPPERE